MEFILKVACHLLAPAILASSALAADFFVFFHDETQKIVLGKMTLILLPQSAQLSFHPHQRSLCSEHNVCSLIHLFTDTSHIVPETELTIQSDTADKTTKQYEIRQLSAIGATRIFSARRLRADVGVGAYIYSQKFNPIGSSEATVQTTELYKEEKYICLLTIIESLVRVAPDADSTRKKRYLGSTVKLPFLLHRGRGQKNWKVTAIQVDAEYLRIDFIEEEDKTGTVFTVVVDFARREANEPPDTANRIKRISISNNKSSRSLIMVTCSQNPAFNQLGTPPPPPSNLFNISTQTHPKPPGGGGAGMKIDFTVLQ